MIIAVAGLPGSGKTHWIKSQIVDRTQPIRYFSAGEGNIIVDRTYLASEFPNLETIDEQNIQLLLSPDSQNITTYIELNWSLDLEKIEPFLRRLECHKVASIVAGAKEQFYTDWADEAIESPIWDNCSNLADIFDNNPPQMYRLVLTGEIIDSPSLDVFWYELTEGAYGEVSRAKGIFNLVDGQSILGDYISGLPQQDFTTLNLPQKLDRNRFSGMEIFGKALDNEAIVRTLEDCCLPDNAVNYYQEQLQLAGE